MVDAMTTTHTTASATLSVDALISAIWTRRTALRDGYTDAELAARVRHGTIGRLQPGFYRDFDADPKDDSFGLRQHAIRATAAGLSAPGLSLSHVSAGVLRGLAIYRITLDRVHLTRNGRGGGRRTPHRQIHAAMLRPDEVERVGRIAVTSIPRTLLDLARTVSLDSAVVAADRALNQGLVTPTALVEQLRATVRCAGLPAARRALEAVDGRSESVGETLTRLGLTSMGLPPSTLQLWIYDENGSPVGRADLAYPEGGVLVEFDGRVKYGALLQPGESIQDVILREKRREEALSALGWLVIRVTWDDLRYPTKLANRIRRAIDDRRSLVAAGIIRGSVEQTPALTVSM